MVSSPVNSGRLGAKGAEFKPGHVLSSHHISSECTYLSTPGDGRPAGESRSYGYLLLLGGVQSLHGARVCDAGTAAGRRRREYKREMPVMINTNK